MLPLLDTQPLIALVWQATYTSTQVDTSQSPHHTTWQHEPTAAINMYEHDITLYNINWIHAGCNQATYIHVMCCMWWCYWLHVTYQQTCYILNQWWLMMTECTWCTPLNLNILCGKSIRDEHVNIHTVQNISPSTHMFAALRTTQVKCQQAPVSQTQDLQEHEVHQTTWTCDSPWLCTV